MRNSLNKLLVMKLFFASCLGFLLLSCNDAKKKDAEADKNPTVITRYDKSLVIAYYHQDSLKERFDYYKKEDQVITRKQKMFEAEMKRRGKELEDYVRRNDEKARNGLLSQNEIMQIQQKAQSMEQELMQYQQAQAAKIEEESVKKLEAITKKIETLGKMYSEKNNIDILLIHGAGGQLNFINEKMNVTSDFIRFLNENQANIEKDLK
jgi:outer membrane protein